MPKRFPESLKLDAMKLFVAGDKTAKEIAEEISTHELEVKPVTIYSWAKQFKWAEQKNVATVDNQQKIAETEGQRFARLQREQMDNYSNLTKKAYTELDGLHFDRAFDAAKALDIGIKGQREVEKGMVNLQFIQDIMAVLVEEIEDQDILGRIAVKLKSLHQNQKES
tara:strand:+ start:1275 stop:1775 length:501 start_codon:yes stop_codon:yes gene_type:complete